MDDAAAAPPATALFVRMLVVIGLVGLTACSSEAKVDGGTIAGFEMGFTPRQATTDAGAVRLRFRNDGKVFHELAIERDGSAIKRVSAGPGATAEMTVDLRPGTYEMTCREPGHYEAGMRGTLVAR